MWQTLKMQVRREPGCEDLPLPAYATEGAVGMDLHAAVMEPVELQPGERRMIPTGLRIGIPEGYEAQIRARSGLALRHGIAMANGVGTLDPDFRGPVQILVINLGGKPFTIRRGERIAQLVVLPVLRVEWKEVEDLPETPRGEGGFGHTG